MDKETFKEQIKRELQKMSRGQIVFFAWLCAVRTLPFISVKGNFSYLEENNRQKHLYAFLRH